jgi:hypothetical protein
MQPELLYKLKLTFDANWLPLIDDVRTYFSGIFT